MADRTRNVLKQMYSIKLYEWLKENKERIEKDNVSKTEAAEQATKALQFTVTSGNIELLAKELGIKWSLIRKFPLQKDVQELKEINNQLLDELSKLQNKVNLIEEELKALRAGVNDIYSQAGLRPIAASRVPYTNSKQTPIAPR